ncbi:MAG TPA: methyltransferase domain-containing protein [Candidatus Binatia bacterium]|nr:methyltransferase domain-containing protein [Candidatus Binatia bacterium]
MKKRNLVIIVFFLTCIGSVLFAQENEKVPYVPSPIEVVDRMLELADVKKGDIVFDIGSGDGRMVIHAAKKYGAKGVGLELDSRLVELARAEAKRQGVDHLVEFRQGDALKADLSAATVVTLYMLPSFNRLLRPILEKQLKSGVRVVVHDYPIEGWDPALWEEMPLRDMRPEVTPHNHILYLYRWKGQAK